MIALALINPFNVSIFLKSLSNKNSANTQEINMIILGNVLFWAQIIYLILSIETIEIAIGIIFKIIELNENG